MHVNVTTETLISMEEVGFVDTTRITGKMKPMAGVRRWRIYRIYEVYGMDSTAIV